MKLLAIVRTATERLSRGRVFKRHILVNGLKIPLFVTPDAQLKYFKFWQNSFDTDLIQIAENCLENESNVWDIGANVGVFTFAASAVAGQGTVVSVEADIWLATLLRRSASLTAHKNKDIRILPLAISETNSIASFLIARRGRASNALEEAGGRSQMGGVREKQYVPTLTLDALARSLPRPDFVKIDVEGAELMVLRGATRVIQEMRPLFYIEVGSEVAMELLQLFKNYRYRAFNAQTGRPLDRCSSNTLFIPEENREIPQRLGTRPATVKPQQNP